MFQQLRKTSIPDFRDQLHTTFRELERLGVAWKGTRFHTYAKAIEAADEQQYPRSVNLSRDKEQQRLFWEATSQSQQLINSSTIWRLQDETVIRDKLTKVMKGADFSPRGSADDLSRNTLLELTTATLLYRSNFDVKLSAQQEDVSATIADQPTFAVECKRPTKRASIDRNLKRLKKQLNGRCKRNGKQGLAVLGTDRLLGLTAYMPYVSNTNELLTIIDRRSEALATHIREKFRRISMKLAPTTRLAATVLVGTVFVGDEGVPVNLGRMTVFTTTKTDAQAGAVVDAVNRYLNSSPREIGGIS